MTNGWIPFVLMPLGAYLLGSIPFGLLMGLARGIDIRQHGSGNIGSTNAGRILGKKWGYLCFLLDLAKGLLPTSLAAAFLHGRLEGAAVASADLLALLLTGAACVLGHVFSIFLKFKGGKGVATSLGMVLGIYPWLTVSGLITFAVWAVVWGIWRFVSLASILASLAFPLILLGIIGVHPDWTIRQLWLLEAFSLVMAFLVIIKHKSNIGRLLRGTESGGRQNAEKP